MIQYSAQIAISSPNRGLDYTLHAFSRNDAATVDSAIPGISGLGGDVVDLLSKIDGSGLQCYLNPEAQNVIPDEVHRFETNVISMFATTGEQDENGEWYSVRIPGQMVIRATLIDLREQKQKTIISPMFPEEDADAEAQAFRAIVETLGYSIHSYLDPSQRGKHVVDDSGDSAKVVVNPEWKAPEEPVLFPA